MNQHGETGHDIGVQAHRLGQRQQGVLARVDFGMMGGGLRDAKQPVQLRENPRQRPTLAQGFNKQCRLRFTQGADRLCPDPFRHQMIHLATGDHGSHEIERFRRDPETQRRIAGAEPGHPQNPHRVFGKGWRDMA